MVSVFTLLYPCTYIHDHLVNGISVHLVVPLLSPCCPLVVPLYIHDHLVNGISVHLVVSLYVHDHLVNGLSVHLSVPIYIHT